MESKTLEYKREYIDEIKYTVVAFANTDGGKLYIGMEDNEQVCGVADPDGTMLRVTNIIRDSIRPDVTMFTEVSVTEIEGKPVVVVQVQRGTARTIWQQKVCGRKVSMCDRARPLYPLPKQPF